MPRQYAVRRWDSDPEARQGLLDRHARLFLGPVAHLGGVPLPSRNLRGRRCGFGEPECCFEEQQRRTPTAAAARRGRRRSRDGGHVLGAGIAKHLELLRQRRAPRLRRRLYGSPLRRLHVDIQVLWEPTEMRQVQEFRKF